MEIIFLVALLTLFLRIFCVTRATGDLPYLCGNVVSGMNVTESVARAPSCGVYNDDEHNDPAFGFILSFSMQAPHLAGPVSRRPAAGGGAPATIGHSRTTSLVGSDCVGAAYGGLDGGGVDIRGFGIGLEHVPPGYDIGGPTGYDDGPAGLGFRERGGGNLDEDEGAGMRAGQQQLLQQRVQQRQGQQQLHRQQQVHQQRKHVQQQQLQHQKQHRQSQMERMHSGERAGGYSLNSSPAGLLLSFHVITKAFGENKKLLLSFHVITIAFGENSDNCPATGDACVLIEERPSSGREFSSATRLIVSSYVRLTALHEDSHAPGSAMRYSGLGTECFVES